MAKVTVIIAAMRQEIDEILNQLEEYQEFKLEDIDAYYFKRHREEYYLVEGKIGKVNTAVFITRLSQILDIKRIINIGTSGAVNKDLELNDVVLATEVSYHDVDATAFTNYVHGQVPRLPARFKVDEEFIKEASLEQSYVKRGLVISGDQFITNKNYIQYGVDKYSDALCVEMEAGAVGQTCYLLNIPFVVIRSISDKISLSDEARQSTMFYDNIKSSMENAVKLLFKLISYN